jgi:hypothetical protein
MLPVTFTSSKTQKYSREADSGQLIKKFRAFYETQRFFTVLTKLSINPYPGPAEAIQPSDSISLRYT